MPARKVLAAFFVLPMCCAPQAAFGIFDGHEDIGDMPERGYFEYEAPTGEYRISGGGANIWATTDAFQFAWKRISGDFNLSADVRFVGPGAVAHRKAVLMVRHSLTPDSAYADAALHGDGLASLQFRPSAGALTQEIRSDDKAPTHLRLERRGNQFTMYVGSVSADQKVPRSAEVTMTDPVYAGLGVCSHDAKVMETAVFSNVKIEVPQLRYRSKLSIYDIHDKSTHVIYTADEIVEAPNWSPDGRYLLINSGGNLFHISPNGGALEKVTAVEGYRCNNDHGPSPDGKMLAISAAHGASKQSQVFLVKPGEAPQLMTPESPSYFHAWSPDGKWLAFVGRRDNNFDLFRVPVTGGPEQHLTSSSAYDDGPDYSPDGKWIYFNSDRSGGWDIWRVPADGGGVSDGRAERVTNDDFEDWFPHPSPNGKWLVFLSFPKGTANHNGRMEGVTLRMIPLPGAKMKPEAAQPLATIFGGQGTINVNSWSPDSKKFAFVVYEPLPR